MRRNGVGRLIASCAAVATMSVFATAGTGVAGASSGAPGVTATSISVGAISTLSGPIAANFSSAVPGVEAYFKMVNAHGGINGRKLILAYNLDTGGNPTQFTQLTHTLIDQDHAFAAVGISTAFFKPTYFVSSGIPTYGYNVTGTWTKAPNLFAAGGSVQYYTAESAYTAFLVKKVHATSVGLVAYNVAASSAACQAAAAGLKKNGIKVGYTDFDVPYPGTSSASDVQRMQQANVNLIVSCMTLTGNVTMARAVQQYGMKTSQLWLNGNTQSFLDKYSSLMKGVYFELQHVPFSAPTKYYPGLAQYLSAMKKYEKPYVYDEVAVQGWESAALFAAGVKAAGRNLTQAAVIAATNKITNFTANGLITPVNWTNAHTTALPPFCSAYIQVVGKTFVPRFGKGHQTFVCFGNPIKPTVTSASPGTPGL
jgi:ABC-type branched-subunit amino acid transport system substrate-binding protein